MAHRGPLAWFNRLLNGSRNIYVAVSGWLVRKIVIAALILAIIGVGVWRLFGVVPTSFLPEEDKAS